MLVSAKQYKSTCTCIIVRGCPGQNKDQPRETIGPVDFVHALVLTCVYTNMFYTCVHVWHSITCILRGVVLLLEYMYYKYKEFCLMWCKQI